MKVYHEVAWACHQTGDAYQFTGVLLAEHETLTKRTAKKQGDVPAVFVPTAEFEKLVAADLVQYMRTRRLDEPIVGDIGPADVVLDYTKEEMAQLKKTKGIVALYGDEYWRNDMCFSSEGMNELGADSLSFLIGVSTIVNNPAIPIVCNCILWRNDVESGIPDEELDAIKQVKGLTVTRMYRNVINVIGPVDGFSNLFSSSRHTGPITYCDFSARQFGSVGYKALKWPLRQAPEDRVYDASDKLRWMVNDASRRSNSALQSTLSAGIHSMKL